MRTTNRTTLLALAGLLALVLMVTAGLTAGAEAKKKGGGKTFEETKQVNAPVPPDGPGVSPPLLSQITIPKKFKKLVVGDVNVTVQTLGSGPAAAEDLVARLIAPNGRSLTLFSNFGELSASIGPLTLDDDTKTLICDSSTPCPADPNATLNPPFAGTASGFEFGSYVNLARFNGVKMRGTWTLMVFDNDDPENSSLVLWGLRVKPAKPVAE